MDIKSYGLAKELKDCFEEIKNSLSQIELDKFKKASEDKLFMYHHGLGMHLRNKMGLWNKEHNDIVKFFRYEIGIAHPDDISSIILTSFHRFLNNKPLELEQQSVRYKEHWKKYGYDPMIGEVGDNITIQKSPSGTT